jgi:hypothetical protein
LRSVDSPQANNQGNDVVEHVEGIGSKGERVDEESGDEFEEEESHVDGNHDLDAGSLGPRHGEGDGRRRPVTSTAIKDERGSRFDSVG